MPVDGRLAHLLESTTAQIASLMGAHGVALSTGLRETIRQKVHVALRCARLVGKLYPDGGVAPGHYEASGPWPDEPTIPMWRGPRADGE